MRICFLADARSPIAQGWIRHFVERGHKVHIISSYPYALRSFPVDSFHVVPVAFSGFAPAVSATRVSSRDEPSPFSPVLNQLRWGRLSQPMMDARYWLATLDALRHVRRVSRLIEQLQPDLIHAMRIPFEGILAGLANCQAPLIISVWGNDFTLFAVRYRLIGILTRRAMARADALHCDCMRDVRLAHTWGFDRSKLTRVLPGGGGVRPEFLVRTAPDGVQDSYGTHLERPVVINPRGYRTYVRNDTFFRAIPLVLQQQPLATFLCPGMHGNPVATRWVKKLAIADSVRLLPTVPHQQMASLFRTAQIMVSPSVHDGTPNTLLEAMASGCFPVAGDIESIREWISDGLNGLLCDSTSPESLATAIVHALHDGELRRRAADYNQRLIADRAEYGTVMTQAEEFYDQVVRRCS